MIDKEKKSVVILDVTCPFENGPLAFEQARSAKQFHYAREAETLRAQGYHVTLDAVVVGALGSWDPSNDRVLKGAGIPGKYLAKMKRLIVMDTINYSTQIYWRHILGGRYTPPKSVVFQQ